MVIDVAVAVAVGDENLGVVFGGWFGCDASLYLLLHCIVLYILLRIVLYK